MKDKVTIIIENLGNWYASVGFSARRYGSGSPCSNEEEIQEAIKSCREWILKEGDIPFIRDLRKQEKQMNLLTN